MEADVLRLCGIADAVPYYEYRRPEMSVIAEAVTDTTCLDELSRMVDAVGSLCDFRYASIFLLRAGEAIKFSKRVSTSLPKAWLMTYDRKNYRFVDPVLLGAYTHDEPFLFSQLTSASPMISDFWDDADAHGIGREGCCFVYEFDNGARVGMSFTSTGSSRSVMQSFSRNRWDLQAFGRLACEAFIRHAAVFEVKGSRPTIEELRFAKSVLDAADHLAVEALLQDERHIDLQRSLCARLGVKTIFQALLAITREGMLDDLPFEGDEVAKTYPDVLERVPPHPGPVLPYEIDRTPRLADAGFAEDTRDGLPDAQKEARDAG
jgi:hypothetical protein